MEFYFIKYFFLTKFSSLHEMLATTKKKKKKLENDMLASHICLSIMITFMKIITFQYFLEPRVKNKIKYKLQIF